MNTDEKSTKRRLWRLTQGLLSIILPVPETKWYLRSSRHITARNLERIRNALPELDTPDIPQSSPDWAKAVADSGLTPAELEKGYLNQRRRWRLIFWSLVIPTPLFMLYPVYSASGITLQQISTGMVLLAGAGAAWSKALIVTYRLWQLRHRRVSIKERGTFRHFMTETDAVRDAIRGDKTRASTTLTR